VPTLTKLTLVYHNKNADKKSFAGSAWHPTAMKPIVCIPDAAYICAGDDPRRPTQIVDRSGEKHAVS